MKPQILTLACAAGLFAGSAHAQDFVVTGGATVTSDYISDGVTQTQGDPALQPYVEAQFGGFYGRLWFSNVNFEDNDDDYEVEVYAGFRGETTGGLDYDLAYRREYYNRTGDAGGDLLASLRAQMADGFSLGTDVEYDPKAAELTSSLSLGYQTYEGVALSTEFGYDQGRSNNFWNAGIKYNFTEAASLDLRYHDTTDSAGVIVLSGSLEVDLFR